MDEFISHHFTKFNSKYGSDKETVIPLTPTPTPAIPVFKILLARKYLLAL